EVYWQTGHIDVIRSEVILEKHSMSGDVMLPVYIDPNFTVDLDTLDDWARAEWLVREGIQDMIHPGHCPRPWPERVSLVVFDFDGVMTDDRVWVNQEGVESVSANRSDGMGIEKLLAAGFKSVIISTEANPVVAMRAIKLGLPYFHGIGDKTSTLSAYLEKEDISAQETVYVGNDVNDLACFPLVACAFAVANAHPEVLHKADRILNHCGGQGAVREICDMLIKRYR
ncbi:MAG: HAD hydrolase family protein, partial [Anaerolineales bacterium]